MRHNDHDELMPCPACPDGYVWTANGPTAKCCPVCKGHAVVKRNGAPCDAAIRVPSDPPYPFCTQPDVCTPLGYCRRDPCCAD